MLVPPLTARISPVDTANAKLPENRKITSLAGQIVLQSAVWYDVLTVRLKARAPNIFFLPEEKLAPRVGFEPTAK
jgi:hypothetical protein